MNKNKATTSYNKIPIGQKNLKIYYYILLAFLFVTNMWPFLIAAIFARAHVFKLMEKFIGQANTGNINTRTASPLRVNTIFDFIENAIGKTVNKNIDSGKIKINSDAIYSTPKKSRDYKSIPNNPNIDTTVKTDAGRSILAIIAFIILILASIIYFYFIV